MAPITASQGTGRAEVSTLGAEISPAEVILLACSAILVAVFIMTVHLIKSNSTLVDTDTFLRLGLLSSV